jgi:hypothetical protein
VIGTKLPEERYVNVSDDSFEGVAEFGYDELELHLREN